jgi:hypothetical protein
MLVPMNVLSRFPCRSSLLHTGRRRAVLSFTGLLFTTSLGACADDGAAGSDASREAALVEQEGEAAAAVEDGGEAAATEPESHGPAGGNLAVSPGALLLPASGLCKDEDVQAFIAGSLPAQASDEELRQLRRERRAALRLTLLRRAHQRIFESAEELLPYLALASGQDRRPAAPGGAAPAGPGGDGTLARDAAATGLVQALAASCAHVERRDPALAATVRTRSERLAELTRHAAITADTTWRGAAPGDGLYAQLLYFAYESALLDLLDQHWNDRRLLPPG